ncbi:arachidonate 12-lipoxygenase, 12R-type-like [Diretmus argenteus]
MAEYKVEVTTGDQPESGTLDYIFLTLIGSEGESERTQLDNYGVDFSSGKTATYTLTSSVSLGKVLLVRLEKDPFFFTPENQWLCSKVVVTTPEKEVTLFPCNRWVSRGEYVELRGGKEYVSYHWTDDDFFGFQFLNGSNPMVIERCTKLPSKFPVTEEMVKPSLEEGTTLEKEMEQGNIFIVDYKRMDGLPKRKYDGGYLNLACGFCLLYVKPDKKLVPIAIQLFQEPSETNPIFLPTDSEHDWTIAKIFLKNPDAIEFESVHHLLNCHFLTEGTITSTIRNLPAIHPIYMSTLAGDGLAVLLERGFQARTYRSRFVPEDIKARGLESIPNFYYRDDALRLWDIISSYAKGMVEYYYPSDDIVRKDSELQAWINEISTHSFLDSKEIGGPSSFETVAELVDFITILMFTMSGQHSAVNNAQFDYNTWMPSNPLLLRKPAPTTKGKTTMQMIMDTLPTIGETVQFLTMGWILTYDYTDMVPLGSFPIERFDEETPKKLMREFKEKLDVLSASITQRNSEIPVPYNYLNPIQMENSIAI